MVRKRVPYLNKIDIVSKINHQTLTIRSAARRYDIPYSTIKDWVRSYKTFGFSGLVPGKSIKYSNELKMKALEDVWANNLSKAEILRKYKITQTSVLNHWIKQYNNDKSLKERGSGVKTMNKGRVTTFNERLVIVKAIIASNYNYQSLAKEYGVSYQQAYSWTQKYKTHGELGLQDKRGRARNGSQQLTEFDQLKIENKALKTKNELLEIENQLAKKLLESENDVSLFP